VAGPDVKRRVCYFTGTRADFGLMCSTLDLIHRSDALDLSIIVTGMHLSPDYGLTVTEVEASGLPVFRKVAVEDGKPSGALMAKHIGQMVIGFTDALAELRPDLALVLGDRGEMLAAAIAAVHLNIPVAHVHGGERSGTVDESIRHAISKLARLHFAATEQSRARLVGMGEDAGRVWAVGAPGLDGLRQLAVLDRKALCESIGFDPSRPIALMVYHPVLQEAEQSGVHAAAIIGELQRSSVQVIAVKPNSDAGSLAVRAALEQRANAMQIHLATHLPRPQFVSWMSAVDVMIGNSSSGIIEAATFGTPVVNIGSRQNLRERNANVIDVTTDAAEIGQAIRQALGRPKFDGRNVYGDGESGPRIVTLLGSVDLTQLTGAKINAY
jgi:GDP/UDP-N,N'-diacetylbacillosamine 2-epimerase (hydrolysing)